MPPSVRATFADADAVADAGEKPATAADAASVRSAVEVRSEVRGESRVNTGSERRQRTRNEPRNEGVGTTVQPWRSSGRGGTESRFQRRGAPAAWAATTITDHPRDINRLCFPANQSQNTSGRARVKLNSRTSCRPRRLRVDGAHLPVLAAIIANFPEDEPIFATEVAEPLHQQHEHMPDAGVRGRDSQCCPSTPRRI